MYHFLTSERSLRVVLASGAIFLAMVVTVFVVLRLAEGIAVQREVAVQQGRIMDLQRDLSELTAALAAHEAQDAREVGQIRASAIVPPAPVVIRPCAPWQANRDKEIGDRLTRLETWRLSLASKEPR